MSLRAQFPLREYTDSVGGRHQKNVMVFIEHHPTEYFGWDLKHEHPMGGRPDTIYLIDYDEDVVHPDLTGYTAHVNDIEGAAAWVGYGWHTTLWKTPKGVLRWAAKKGLEEVR